MPGYLDADQAWNGVCLTLVVVSVWLLEQRPRPPLKMAELFIRIPFTCVCLQVPAQVGAAADRVARRVLR
jgi:hypothetical protein